MTLPVFPGSHFRWTLHHDETETAKVFSPWLHYMSSMAPTSDAVEVNFTIASFLSVSLLKLCALVKNFESVCRVDSGKSMNCVMLFV